MDEIDLYFTQDVFHLVFDTGPPNIIHSANLAHARSALQDPLQNGIVHKLKKSKTSAGMKRQLSLNEKQSNNSDSKNPSKRRHSTELPAVDPFTLSSTLANVKNEFQQPNDHFTSRPSLQRQPLQTTYSSNNPISSPSNFTISGGTITVSSTNLLMNNNSLPGNQSGGSLNSSLNLCQTMGVSSAVTPSTVTGRNSAQENFLMAQQQQQQQQQTTKVTVAPNVTITQGMVVSLPSAAYQQPNAVVQQQSGQQQNMYAMGLKNMISQPSPNRTVQHIQSSVPNLIKNQVRYLYCF